MEDRALGNADMLVMGQRKKGGNQDDAMSGNLMGTSLSKESICTWSLTRSRSLTHCSLSEEFF